MSRTITITVLLLVIIHYFSVFSFGSSGKNSIRDLRVKKGHPILFVDQDLVKKIKGKTEDLARFHSNVKTYYEKSTDDPRQTDLIRREVEKRTTGTHPGGFISTSMYYGVDGYINDSALSQEYGKQYALALLELPPGSVDQAAGRAFALGVLYDWLYDHLDPDLRKRIREGIMERLPMIISSESNVSGGHRLCWWDVYALAAVLAIRHDIEQDDQKVQDRYFEYLDVLITKWRTKYNPAYQWIAGDGGYHMGWAYGQTYTVVTPYYIWEYATDEESWFSDWQRERVYWYLYGYRGKGWYGSFPYSGDVWSTYYSSGTHGFQILTSASVYDNEYAKGLYNYFGNQSESYWDILYKHFDSDAGISPDNLPLSRHFRNAGFVIMRDNWDVDENALMVFKSTSFYSVNHHHKDQNAFTIFYKAPLAIDSGGYNICGAYGSEHWRNYYTRSIAHNTILIYDPEEKYSLWGKPVSNDGGQEFFRISNPTLEDMQDGGDNHLDGIQCYENHEDYTYTMGDATKAYSSHKLEVFKRYVVYLRDHSYEHPAVIIYDRVISKNAAFKKTYLLHSIEEPVINNGVVTIEGHSMSDKNNGGRLFNEALLPKNNVINKVGGVRNSQEFYAADDGTGKPYNYSDEIKDKYGQIGYEAIRSESSVAREAGEWRVEISPADSRLDDTFLNVMSVTDGDNRYTRVHSEYVSTGNLDGVVIKDNDGEETTLVLFKRNNTELSGETIQKVSFRKMLIVGLEKKAKYSIKYKEGSLSIRRSSEGSYTSSDQGTIYITDAQNGRI